MKNHFSLSSGLFSKTTLQNRMTPQLQEAIKILQFSYEDLVSFIDQQITDNPFLKKDDPYESPEDQTYDAFGPDLFSPRKTKNNTDSETADTLASAAPLNGHQKITQQIGILFPQEKDKRIAHDLLAQIDDAGYFRGSLEKTAQTHQTSLKHMYAIFTKLQQCEPVGVFARNLSECLSLQLKDQGLYNQAYKNLLANLDNLSKGLLNKKKMAFLCGVSPEELSAMMKKIRSLSPKPLEDSDIETPAYITPEVLMTRSPETGAWLVQLNPYLTNRIHFNQGYYQNIREKISDRTERKYLNQQAIHANWLQKALEQRNKTLLSVSKEIVSRQTSFFEKGIHYLEPLTLKAIAQPLGIHESTVSRITTQKYISTPYGLFELKYFFSSGFESVRGQSVSSSSLKQAISDLIQKELPDKPLSDLVLTDILKTRGIPIARRTVSKYREMMGIPSSFNRKKSKRLKDF